MVKDRLLDLLSREDEEESHGEDVVRANPALSLPPPLTFVWENEKEGAQTNSKQPVSIHLTTSNFFRVLLCRILFV